MRSLSQGYTIGTRRSVLVFKEDIPRDLAFSSRIDCDPRLVSKDSPIQNGRCVIAVDVCHSYAPVRIWRTIHCAALCLRRDFSIFPTLDKMPRDPLSLGWCVHGSTWWMRLSLTALEELPD